MLSRDYVEEAHVDDALTFASPAICVIELLIRIEHRIFRTYQMNVRVREDSGPPTPRANSGRRTGPQACERCMCTSIASEQLASVQLSAET